MQEFSITDLPNQMPLFLSVMADGECISLRDHDGEIAIVTPTKTSPTKNENVRPIHPDGRTFAEAMRDFLSTREIEAVGLTTDEIDSWRDKSPGHPSPFE